MESIPALLHLVRATGVAAAIAMAICALPHQAEAAQTDSLAGEWVGRLDFASEPALLRITVQGAPRDGWTASILLQPLTVLSPVNAEARRISESWRGVPIATDGASWRIVAGSGPDVIRVEVRTMGNASTATVRFRTHTAQSALHHLASVDATVERHYTGTYRLPSGGRIHIWRPSTSGPIVDGIRRSDGFLTYLDEASGRSGVLYPVARGAYIAGSVSLLPEPVQVRAWFREEANGAPRLTWRETGKRELVARRSNAYRREDNQLKGRGGALGCDALIPTGRGAHPGVVLVPGAGATDRYGVYMIAQIFAEHGVAALTCDKRGTGTSDGDWRLTSFEEQADDVAVGVRFLQGRPEIDAGRVGVWGFSEGAWVAPITVADNPRIAFLILAAAPATSRRESVAVGNVDRLKREGVSAAEIARYREFFERYQQAIMENDAGAIERLWKEYAGAAWLPANMPNAHALNDWSWRRARLTWPHEPASALRRITSPVLAIWGAEDETFPPETHKPLVEQALRAAGNRDVTLRVVPRAEHSFRPIAPSFIEITGYSSEYFRSMLEWIRAKVVKARR